MITLMRSATRLVAMAMPLLATPPALATVLFSQFGVTESTIAFVNSQQSGGALVSQVADDFSLAATDTVNRVRFWGGIWNGDTPTPVPSFKVPVYADNGGTPTGTPGDPSATALHSFTVAATSVEVGNNWGQPIYEYEADLGAGFTALSGVTDRLAIQANLPDPELWGWAQQDSGWGQSGMIWNDYWIGFSTWTATSSLSASLQGGQFELLGVGSGAVPARFRCPERPVSLPSVSFD